MKKRILLLMTAMSLSLTMQAQTLFINGEELDVDVDEIRITTEGNESVVVDTGTTPDPDPDPTPDPDPEPVDPPDDVVLDYHIHNFSNNIQDVYMTIPESKTIASRFSTPDEPNLQGGIYFQATGSYKPRTTIWISKEPGDPDPLNGSRYCKREAANFTYHISWAISNGFAWYCILQPNTTYYLNTKHFDDEARSSVTSRSIY